MEGWEAAKRATLILSSSAPPERVFSMHGSLFKDAKNMLVDFRQLSLMLRYNNMWRDRLQSHRDARVQFKVHLQLVKVLTTMTA